MDALTAKLEALRESLVAVRARVHAVAIEAGTLPATNDAWDVAMLAANIVGGLGTVEAGIAVQIDSLGRSIQGRQDAVRAEDAVRRGGAN